MQSAAALAAPGRRGAGDPDPAADPAARPGSTGAIASPLGRKNPPAVFVLSPPRSGSTLLRVMLAGNPALFAPPELELLGFTTMAERRAAFTGRDSFWLEGLIRAVMELRGVRRGGGARGRLAEAEDADLPVPELYRRLQERLAGPDGRAGCWSTRRLPMRSIPSVLERAEEVFEGARYLHLLRHPYGMIRSFEEAKLEQVFFRYPHPFGAPRAGGAGLGGEPAQHPSASLPGWRKSASTRCASRSWCASRSGCCAGSAGSWGWSTTPNGGSLPGAARRA